MKELQSSGSTLENQRIMSNAQRKTKIVCTIGPSTSSREMIWKLAETGMNVARLNMSHGDHASHKKTIDLVKEYNALFEDKVIAIMLDTKVCWSLMSVLSSLPTKFSFLFHTNFFYRKHVIYCIDLN